jgi:putative transposase
MSLNPNHMCLPAIELNPVRSGIVPHPQDYLWSSYRDNDYGMVDPLITPYPDYSALSQNNNQRREVYRQFIAENLDNSKFDDIRGATNGNFIVGNDRFREEIAYMLGRRVTPGKPGRPKRK